MHEETITKRELLSRADVEAQGIARHRDRDDQRDDRLRGRVMSDNAEYFYRNTATKLPGDPRMPRVPRFSRDESRQERFRDHLLRHGKSTRVSMNSTAKLAQTGIRERAAPRRFWNLTNEEIANSGAACVKVKRHRAQVDPDALPTVRGDYERLSVTMSPGNYSGTIHATAASP